MITSDKCKGDRKKRGEERVGDKTQPEWSKRRVERDERTKKRRERGKGRVLGRGTGTQEKGLRFGWRVEKRDGVQTCKRSRQGIA